MHELVEWFSQQKNKKVLLTVSHKNNGTFTKTTDFSNYVVVKTFTILDDLFQVALTDAMQFAEPTKMSLAIPITAETTVTNEHCTFSYIKNTDTITLSFGILSLPEEKNVQQKDTPMRSADMVKEVKDPNTGEVKKLIIHIPADSEDEKLLQAMQLFLYSLLMDWKYISLAKRVAGQLTVIHQKLLVTGLELVYLPGDSFFQLTAKDNKEVVTFEISLEVFINMERKRMSFTFEDVSYELVRIS